MGGVAVDRVVPRQQPDPAGAVGRHEVAELLVRERLQRRRVEALAPVTDRAIDRVLPHHGLPGARRGRDQHRLPPVEGLHGRDLEIVQGERVPLGERPGGGHGVSLGSPGSAQRIAAGFGPTIRLRAPGTTSNVAGAGPTRSPSAYTRTRRSASIVDPGRPASSARRDAGCAPPGRRSGTPAGTRPSRARGAGRRRGPRRRARRPGSPSCRRRTAWSSRPRRACAVPARPRRPRSP